MLHTAVLVLVLQVWCCFVKHDLVTLVVMIMILEDNFLSTIYNFSILCLEHHYCGDQQWRLLAFTYLKVKYAKYLSCLWAYFRWSWSCHFGLCLGLTNLVLFTSLLETEGKSAVQRRSIAKLWVRAQVLKNIQQWRSQDSGRAAAHLR